LRQVTARVVARTPATRRLSIRSPLTALPVKDALWLSRSQLLEIKRITFSYGKLVRAQTARCAFHRCTDAGFCNRPLTAFRSSNRRVGVRLKVREKWDMVARATKCGTGIAPFGRRFALAAQRVAPLGGGARP